MSTGASEQITPLVLLVEDHDRTARLMLEILQANGYRAVVATSGQQAIDTARRLHPALILMDMQLPDMDGATVTQKLKAVPETAAIPVVAVTAHAMSEHRTKLLDAGCCSFIAKPISYRPFLQEIESVLCDRLQPA